LKAEFFAKAMAIDKHTKALVDFTAAAKEKWSGVESWGAFGLCWGGKVCISSSSFSGSCLSGSRNICGDEDEVK
jgi:hypothetical protein